MKLNELENEALKLDPPSRARLAEVLLRSLDELSEREVEALWLDEAERRERAWDAGEAEGIPAEQVMAKAKRPLKELLLAIPPVDEDADFERNPDRGRDVEL
ncbi:MAG TPA: addiction module protein [Thermoanaerobaculia bacterium]|nr:addiction module protein [Thermoanaerobaculia bacterium]